MIQVHVVGEQLFQFFVSVAEKERMKAEAEKRGVDVPTFLKLAFVRGVLELEKESV